MFYYRELKIQSAAALADIEAYLRELGAAGKPGLVYEYGGLEIEITVGANSALAKLGVPQHTIEVRGERAAAEKFLTGLRLRFLSAGG